jgi:hypothetical protein
MNVNWTLRNNWKETSFRRKMLSLSGIRGYLRLAVLQLACYNFHAPSPPCE